MTSLRNAFITTIKAGLARQSVKSCSKWASQYRIMGRPFPGPYSFQHYPWTREMHDEDGHWVGMKSAQAGFTEVAINRAFYLLDIRGMSVLYLLPTDDDATHFTASRFDPALELSPRLQEIFTDVSSVHHKRAGTSNLYIRGTRSRSKLKSLPASLIVFDEEDEMATAAIALATERASGQLYKQFIHISTPTIPGERIHAQWLLSDQSEFFFRCPSCNDHQRLIYPDSINITAESEHDPRIEDTHYICTKCHHNLGQRTNIAQGEWVPARPGIPFRGFHVNQMYSPTITAKEIATASFRARMDPGFEQELYNSKLGLPHIVGGSRITDEDIVNVTKSFQSGTHIDRQKIRTVGIDVGAAWLHVVVHEYTDTQANTVDINARFQPKVLNAFKLADPDHIKQVMFDYQAHGLAIDANPERRMAREVCASLYPSARMVMYTRGVVGKDIVISKEEEMAVHVDRTSWLDLTLGRYRAGTVSLPFDIPAEFKQQIKAPVRILKREGGTGAFFAKYEEGTLADHYAHAANYAEVALAILSKSLI